MIEEVLSFAIGKVLRYPLITGLLLFSVVGMGWTHFKTKAAIEQKYKAAQAEAIIKNAKENQLIKDKEATIVNEVRSANHKIELNLEKEIARIKNLPANKCLDAQLSDLGL